MERLRSKSTSSILGRLGSFKKNRRDDDSKVFTVQYLGCQQVAKSEGLEVVKGPIQVCVCLLYTVICVFLLDYTYIQSLNLNLIAFLHWTLMVAFPYLAVTC